MQENEAIQPFNSEWIIFFDTHGGFQFTTVRRFRTEIEEYFRPYFVEGILRGYLDFSCFISAKWQFDSKIRNPELADVFLEYVFGIFDDLPYVEKEVLKMYLDFFAMKKLESYGYSQDNSNYYYYRWENVHRHRKIEIPMYQYLMTCCDVPQLLHKPFLFQDYDMLKRLLMYITPLQFISDDLCCYPYHVLSRIR